MNLFNLEIIHNEELFKFAKKLKTIHKKDVIAMKVDWSYHLDALCKQGDLSEDCYNNSDGFEELSRIWGI